MSVLLEIPHCDDRNLSRERSKSSEYLDDPPSYCPEVMNMRAQSTQDLSWGEGRHNSSKYPPKKKPKVVPVEDLLSRSGTTRRKDIPFSVKFAVSPARKAVDYGTPDGKTSGKSKANLELLDQTLLQIKASLSSLQTERIEMEARLDWIIDDIRVTQMSTARVFPRSLSVPNEHSVMRSKSSSHSPHRPSFDGRTGPDDGFDQSDGWEECPDGAMLTAEGKSFLNRRKSMREKRDSNSLDRRPSFGSSFYRSLRVKKDTHLTPSSSVQRSSSFQRGVKRAASMRQKLSSIVKSPTNLLRHRPSTSSTSLNKNSPASLSKSNVSLSPNILRSDARVKNPSTNLSHRNSLPEAILITTIPEDGIEQNSEIIHTHYMINHDRLDSLEEKSIAKNWIIRRSSLTGQLEQYYKSAAAKRHSHSGEVESCGSRRGSEGGSSVVSEGSIGDSSFSRKSSVSSNPKSPDRRSMKTIILPGTETTV